MKHSQKCLHMQAQIAGLALLLILLMPVDRVSADEGANQVVVVKLGDYRFSPDEIKLVAGQPTVLRLVNTDKYTPHNFTMDPVDGVAGIDVDVPHGKTVDVHLSSLPPGRYTFYCASRLLFMKSHRKKGMEGTMIISSE